MSPLFRLGVMLLGLLAGSVPAGAQTQTELLNGFDNFLIRHAANPPPPGGDKVYSTTGAGGHWGVDQWDIPGPELTAFVASQSGGAQVFSASAPESSVKITRQAGVTLVSLSQNGAVLPCDGPTGRSRESDLFISSGVKSAALKKIPLSQLSALYQLVKVSVQGGDASVDKACKANKGGAALSIILSDTAVHPGQTMFYQLFVGVYCRNEPGGDPCHSSVDPLVNYSSKNPYGVNDSLPLLGVPWVRPGALTALRVDLLPRLKQAIAIGPPGIDPDILHWRVTSVYGGQIIFGDVTLASQWEDYRLIAITK